jgi:hypothetical protein
MLLKLQPHESDWQWILVTALSQSSDRQMYAKLEAYVRGERDPKLRERLEVKLQDMRRNLEIK